MDWPTVLALLALGVLALMALGIPVAVAFIAVNAVGAWFFLGANEASRSWRAT